MQHNEDNQNKKNFALDERINECKTSLAQHKEFLGKLQLDQKKTGAFADALQQNIQKCFNRLDN